MFRTSAGRQLLPPRHEVLVINMFVLHSISSSFGFWLLHNARARVVCVCVCVCVSLCEFV